MERVDSLPGEDSHFINRVITSSLVLLAVTVASVYLYRGDKYAILALGGLVFLVLGSWRVWMLPALYLILVIVFPHDNKELDFPILFHPKTFIPAFLLMILILMADRILHPSKTLRNYVERDYMGPIITVFILWTILIFLYGMAMGNSTRFMMYEISFLSMYLSYFLWRSLFRHHGHIIQWNWLILGAGVIAGIELLWYISLTFTDILNFILQRTLNRQPQITLISVPLAMTLILTRKTTWARIFGFGLLVVTLMHTFLFQ